VDRVLEKLIVTQLVKRFPAFYGTRRFITVFARARHWPLSCSRCIQSTPSHPVSQRSVLILSNFTPVFHCLGRSIDSVQARWPVAHFVTCYFFYGELLALRPAARLEDHIIIVCKGKTCPCV